MKDWRRAVVGPASTIRDGIRTVDHSGVQVALVVDDAAPLVKAVDEEEDDLFGSMLYLKVRLVGAAGSLNDDVARRVAQEVVAFWEETLSGWRDGLREFALAMLPPLAGSEVARRTAAQRLLELTQDE